MLPQPPDSELSVEEEEIPTDNAGNLDGKYDCESCNVESDEATSDGKDNDEEGSCQTHRQVESVGDENMLSSPFSEKIFLLLKYFNSNNKPAQDVGQSKGLQLKAP